MIRSVRHVALAVPDVKAGVAFFTAFGLDAVERADHVAMRSPGRVDDEIILIEKGGRRKLHHLSLGANAEDFAGLAFRLRAIAIVLLKPPYACAPDGLWFRDPEGTLINIETVSTLQPEIGRLRQPRRSQDSRPRPLRLGHVVIFARDVAAQTKFYCDVLGFIVSDRIAGSYASFLRLAGGGDHHVLALLHSEANGYHHASFEMACIDDTEAAARSLQAAGYNHAWGPGRHGIGANYFHYFRDPWNGLAEYFCEIDQVPQNFRQGEDWDREKGLFSWSARKPPPDFGTNYEIED